MSDNHTKALEFCCHSGPAAQASKLFGRNADSRADSSDSSVFTVQLWKAAGLMPKLLGKAGRGVLRDLAPNAGNGSSKQQVRTALSGAGPSNGSLSGICCELNPKTLKAAAMHAYEASTAEDGSAAQLSGSTGHSPSPKGAAERDPMSSGHEASNGVSRARQPEVPTLEAARAAQQRQVHHLARQLQRCNSQGQAAPSGPGIAPDARGCLICGVSCSIYVTVPGISAPLVLQPSAGTPEARRGAPGLSPAPLSAGYTPAQLGAGGSMVGVSSLGSHPGVVVSTPRTLTPAVSMALLEGPPPLIGCSQCRKPMHLDCFVAHYNVVPARRDFTYCPAHVYVPKPKPPGTKSHHKRERSSTGEQLEKKKKHRPERPPAPPVVVEEEVDDGDGDYVPRATSMRLRGSSPLPTSRRSSQSARLRTRSSITGDALPDGRAGHAAEGGAAEVANLSDEGAGAEGSAKRRKPLQLQDPAPDPSPEQHESRSGSPAQALAAAQEEAKPWVPAPEAQPASPSPPPRAAEPSGGSLAGGLVHPERSVLDRVRVPKNQRSARTPRAAAPSAVPGEGSRRNPSPLPISGDAQQGSSPVKEEAAAEREAPVSVVLKAPDAASGSPRSAASADSAPAEDLPSAPAEAVPASRAVAPAASAAPATEPRRRELHPASPRSQRPAAPESMAAAAGRAEKSGPGPQSPRSAASHHAAKGTVKSPKQRAADVAVSKGDKSAARSAVAMVATPVDSPVAFALAQGSADLKDEELARLLHEELNAPSRRRGKRLPDAFTTPPLSPPLGIERANNGGGSAKKAQADRKSAAATTPSSAPVLGTGAAGKEGGRGTARNPGAA